MSAYPALSVGDLDTFQRAVDSPNASADESWRPVVFTLLAGQLQHVRTACAQRRLTLVDTFERQLADLAVIRAPGDGSDGPRAAFVAAARCSAGSDERLPGHWVYFPWLHRVVRVLDPEDYFDLVTDRNRDKITRDEQRHLRRRTIGVVGLSVGGEAAVTLAQEHLCGHLVVADYDRLDLSNLNRLNAGVDELGLHKTTILARRVARIDPYLRVSVFPEGVTSENLDQFLDGLDLLVEECDGLALKYDIRTAARARRLDVIYAADERGFLSVEPYSRYPELPPFHDIVRERPRARSSYATAGAFMRALTEWVGGWDGISERSRATVSRIGDTHSGYPQLASEARFAAGQLGHVARRLLIGEPLSPFLGHVDLDAIVGAEQ